MFRPILFLLLISTTLYSQNYSHVEIDSALWKIYDDTHNNLTFKEGIIANQKIIEQCKKIGYKKGVGNAYLNIANFLSYGAQYKESLKHLELAEKNLIAADDPYLKCLLYIEYGKVYAFLNLYETSLSYYNKAIFISSKIKNKKQKRKSQHYVYACKADNFTHLARYDSMYFYFLKSYHLDPDPITAFNIADYFIRYKKQQIDSADYYLKVAIHTLEQKKYEPYQKLTVMLGFGKYHHEKQNYPEALDYYFKALSIAKQIKKDDERRNLYQLISKTYKASNNEIESANYQLKYSALNDSLLSEDKKALITSVDKLMKDKESEKKEIENRSDMTIVLISISVMVALGTGYYLYERKKKEKETVIRKQKEEINQKEIEKRNLEHKVNDSFDEVLQLARKNDPAFLARFKEVYSEFCENILNKYPEMSNSELTFCAYLKLNFSTKEIANYTFVTPKAVEIRKNRFRKKMNISSTENLYVWIAKI